MASTKGNQGVARRYATAFLDLAVDSGQVDRIAGDMGGLQELLAESAEFRYVINNDTLARQAQQDAVQAVARAAQMSDLTEKLLGLLAQKRRLSALPAIVEAVLDMMSAHKGEVIAHVTSAAALPESRLQSIGQALAAALGHPVQVRAAVDPAIMGGLVVRVGSRMIDSSVRTKLERISRALTSTGPSSEQEKMREVA